MNNKIKTFRVTATIELDTEAYDENEALEIGVECLDWGNADFEVEEILTGSKVNELL